MQIFHRLPYSYFCPEKNMFKYSKTCYRHMLPKSGHWEGLAAHLKLEKGGGVKKK